MKAFLLIACYMAPVHSTPYPLCPELCDFGNVSPNLVQWSQTPLPLTSCVSSGQSLTFPLKGREVASACT